MYRRFGLIVLVLFCAVTACAQDSTHDVAKPTTAKGPTDAKAGKLAVIDAASLASVYEEDSRGADESYKSRDIIVRGLVTKVIANVALLGDQEAYDAVITLAEGKGAQPKHIVGCAFQSTDMAGVLKLGEVVTVTGTCIGKSAQRSGVFLINCSLDTGHSAQAASPAAVPATTRQNVSSPAASSCIEVGTLVKQYEESSTRADLQLIGKRFAVKGYVLNVVRGCVWLGEKDTFSSVKRDDLHFDVAVQMKPIVACDFLREAEGNRMNIGDLVTITGTCVGRLAETGYPGSIMMTDCSAGIADKSRGSAPVSTVKKSEVRATDLSAAVLFHDTYFDITNKNAFDWSNIEFEINSQAAQRGYTFKLPFPIKAQAECTVGTVMFADSDGRKYEPTTDKLRNLTIRCDTPKGKGLYCGTWEKAQ